MKGGADNACRDDVRKADAMLYLNKKLPLRELIKRWGVSRSRAYQVALKIERKAKYGRT